MFRDVSEANQRNLRSDLTEQVGLNGRPTAARFKARIAAWMPTLRRCQIKQREVRGLFA